MIKIKNNKKSIPKWAILSLVIVLLALAGFGAHKVLRSDAPASTTATANNINYGPATEQEKKEAEDNKAAVEQRAKTDSATPSSGIKTVMPVISSWGTDPDTKNFELAAYIPDVYEDGGQCVLTLTKDGRILTRTISGRKDVNRTTCAPFTLPGREVTAGDWTASISYTSAAASGSSEQTITVRPSL